MTTTTRPNLPVSKESSTSSTASTIAVAESSRPDLVDDRHQPHVRFDHRACIPVRGWPGFCAPATVDG